MFILQAANFTTPAVAFFGFAVHVSVAPDGVSVTSLLLVVAVFCQVSCTVTVGCVAKALFSTVGLLGDVVNASLADAPALTVNAAEVPAIVPSFAVSVVLWASYSVIAVAVPTPSVKVTAVAVLG